MCICKSCGSVISCGENSCIDCGWTIQESEKNCCELSDAYYKAMKKKEQEEQEKVVNL